MAILTIHEQLASRLQAYADELGTTAEAALAHLLDAAPVAQTDQPAVIALDNTTNGLDGIDLNAEFLQMALQHVPTIIFIFDVAKQRTVYNNDVVRDVLGYDPAFIRAADMTELADLYHPHDAEKLAENHERLMTSPYTNPVYTVEYRMRHQHGTYRWLQTKNRVITRDADAKPQLIIGVTYDITASRLAEAQLRRTENELKDLNWSLIEYGANRELMLDQLNKDLIESEQHYRRIVETTNEGVWVLDHDGNTTYANERMADMLGYTVADMLSHPLWDFMSDEAITTAKFNFERRRNGIAEVHDFCFQHRDGHDIWTSISTTPMTDDSGVFIGTLGMVTDITERKQVEQQLKENTRFVESLTHTAPMIISVFDVNTDHGVYANAALERISGYSMAELQEHNNVLQLITHPDDLPGLRRYQQTIEDLADNDTASYEMRVIRKDGSIRWLFAQSTPFKRDADGQVSQYLSVAQDITERKQAEATIHASEQRLRALTENSPDIIFSVEVEYQRIEYLNRSDLFGYDLSIFGTISEMMDIIYLDDLQVLVDAWVIVLSEKTLTTQEIEYRICNKAGEVEWVRARLTPYLFDDDGRVTHVLNHITPITEQKEAELAMVNNVERERELSHMQSQFVMTASHEFRTPLTTILSSTDLLRTRYDQMRPEWRTRHFEKVESQVTHMTELLDDVLMVGRLEANTLPVNLQTVDVCDLVGSVIQQERDNGAACPIEFTCKPRGFTAQLDPKLMHKIASNLVSNALKYSPDGDTVYVDVERAADVFHLTVRDEGIGISVQDQAKLFTPFHRGQNVDTIQGTGLGLSITKHAIDLHKGDIQIISDVGKGTTFIVTLPIQLQHT